MTTKNEIVFVRTVKRFRLSRCNLVGRYEMLAADQRKEVTMHSFLVVFARVPKVNYKEK